MSFLKRPLSFASLLLALALLPICGWTWHDLGQAARSAEELRQTTRIAAQLSYRLQSLTTAYELTLNEYYSTVIDEPRYREKVGRLLHAIDSDLIRLGSLSLREYSVASNELRQLTGEMEQLRTQLDKALTEGGRDWDAAREALFKINILSTQAIEVAGRAASATAENTAALESALVSQHQQAQWLLILAIVFAGLLSLALAAQQFRPQT